MKHPRIALIHATPLAIDPIVAAFGRLWPEARIANLLMIRCQRTSRQKAG